MQTKFEYLIGIDPSFVTMGAARHRIGTEDLETFSGDFDSVVEWLAGFDLSATCVVVENPALDGNTFNAWMVISNALTEWSRSRFSPKGFDKVSSIIRQFLKISRDAGENAGAGKYFLRKMERAGIPFVQIAPSQREKAKTVDRYKERGKTRTKTRRINPKLLKFPTKMSGEQFESYLGFPHKCNEHCRDATSLVWKRASSWANEQMQIQHFNPRYKNAY